MWGGWSGEFLAGCPTSNLLADPTLGVSAVGSYSCSCYLGYAGDGFTCQPSALPSGQSPLDVLQQQYSTQGAGQVGWAGRRQCLAKYSLTDGPPEGMY